MIDSTSELREFECLFHHAVFSRFQQLTDCLRGEAAEYIP